MQLEFHVVDLADAWVYCAVVAAIAVVVLWIAWRLLRRRRRETPPTAPDLTLDVSTLGEGGPPPGPPTLELYNLPMRLAAVILAPVGLSRELPPDDRLASLLDAIVPGLDRVAALHGTVIRRWPQQISTTGFAHLVFNNVRLPGLGGKGTPWSAAAGVFQADGQPVMAGLVLCAARPNSLGQTIIESEHQWLGCLRVKWEG